MALPGSHVVKFCKNYYISTYLEGTLNFSGLHIMRVQI